MKSKFQENVVINGNTENTMYFSKIHEFWIKTSNLIPNKFYLLTTVLLKLTFCKYHYFSKN